MNTDLPELPDSRNISDRCYRFLSSCGNFAEIDVEGVDVSAARERAGEPGAIIGERLDRRHSGLLFKG